MIDTIKITIPRFDPRRIYSPENFSPEFKVRNYSQTTETERKTFSTIPYSNKFVLHSKILENEYQPSVEVYEKIDREKQIVEYTMKIEFSVTKLVYENSIEEMDPKDKETVIFGLENKLKMCGIILDIQTIANSTVSKFHIAKNILLPNDVLMVNLIDELKKAGLGKNYDSTETSHIKEIDKIQQRNLSETLQFYCGTRGYAFYDKVQDIKNKTIKSNDKSKTTYEKELLVTYDLEDRSIFRYEYRLNHQQTVQSEINTYYSRDYKTPVIFTDLFNDELWKNILVKSWCKIINRPENQLALKFNTEEIDVYKNILAEAKKNSNNGHSLNSAFTSFGLAMLAKKYGLKFIRKETAKIWSDRACGERLDNKIEIANELMKSLPFSKDIDYVDQEIRKCERLTGNKLKNTL